MKKRIQYSDEPMGKLNTVHGLLPPPSEIFRRDKEANGAHISINENASNDVSFKIAAKKRPKR